MSNAAPQFTSNEWKIVGLTSVAHTVCHMCELAIAGAFLGVMSEFEVSAKTLGWIAFPGFLLFGIGAVPTGIWADRRGSREVLLWYFGFVAAASLLVAFSWNKWVFTIGLTLLGLAISLYHPAGLAMISHGCRARGRALGMNGVAGSTGVAIGPYLGLLMITQMSWRHTYVILAIVSVLGGILLYVFRFDHTEHHEAPPHVSDDAHTTTFGKTFYAMSFLFLAMFLGGFNYRCFTTALPTFLSTSESGQSESNSTAPGNPVGSSEQPSSPEATPQLKMFKQVKDMSGIWKVLVVLGIGALGQLIGGYGADRFGPGFLYPFFIFLTAPLAFLMVHSPESWALPIACILAIFIFAQQPVENTMVAQATPPGWRSRMYGLKFILSFGIGSVGVIITGYVWEAQGLSRVFEIYALVAIVMGTAAAIHSYRSAHRTKY